MASAPTIDGAVSPMVTLTRGRGRLRHQFGRRTDRPLDSSSGTLRSSR